MRQNGCYFGCYVAPQEKISTTIIKYSTTLLTEAEFRLPTRYTPKKQPMNREKLINAFRQSATAEGYTFYSAEERLIPQMIRQYPAVWLSPPEFHSIDGRNHGQVVYSVKMHALKEGAKLDDASRAEIDAELELSIVDIFSSLSECDFIAEVDKLQIRHTSHTLTTHGEVAATATAEVITFF